MVAFQKFEVVLQVMGGGISLEKIALNCLNKVIFFARYFVEIQKYKH